MLLYSSRRVMLRDANATCLPARNPSRQEPVCNYCPLPSRRTAHSSLVGPPLQSLSGTSGWLADLEAFYPLIYLPGPMVGYTEPTALKTRTCRRIARPPTTTAHFAIGQ